jgi:carbon-monoxide dehydrogenase medium subunit
VIFLPNTVEEALDALEQQPDAKILAGGQSLVPILNLGLVSAASLIDVTRIGSLSYITGDGEGAVRIGALTTHAEIAGSALLRSRRLQVLADMADEIADVQVRSRGTIGGSVCHADPAGDYAPVLCVLGANLKITGSGGDRVVPAEEFFKGAFETAVGPSEILQEVEIPVPDEGGRSAFLKFRYIRGAIVSCCALCRIEDGVYAEMRLCLGGAEARPVRLSGCEQLLLDRRPGDDGLLEEVAELASSSLTEPLQDVHISSEYRRQLAGVCVKRALKATTSLEDASGTR